VGSRLDSVLVARYPPSILGLVFKEPAVPKIAKKVRIRCPTCGMLVWQSRLNKHHDFEFIIQETTNRGHGIEHTYRPAGEGSEKAVRMFQVLLAVKMAQQAQELLKGLDTGVEIDISYPADEDERLEDVEEEAGDRADRRVRATAEIEYEPETLSYQFDDDGVTYEVDVPVIQEDHVRRRLARLPRWWKRRSRAERQLDRIEEFDVVGHDLEAVGYADVEVVTEVVEDEEE
jgi:hypothetical protein